MSMDHFVSLIVGLGNPGTEYHGTRHNVGAQFVEYLAHEVTKSTLKFSKEFKGYVANSSIGGKNCSLLIPTTYMNKSGESVSAFAHFYKTQVSAILVVHDDLDLPVGSVRLKSGGGHGGHHGLENIALHLHSTDFLRLRIGIGRPNDKQSATEYVLSRLKREEREQISNVFVKIVDVLPEIIANNLAKAMNILHTETDNEA